MDAYYEKGNGKRSSYEDSVTGNENSILSNGDYLKKKKSKKNKKSKKKNKKVETKSSSKKNSSTTIKIKEPTEELKNSSTNLGLSKKVVSRKEEAELYSSIPPHVTSWEIILNPINGGETELLIFYVNMKPVSCVEITVDNLSDLLDALNSNIISSGETEVTGWSIREPEDSSLPPIFSLTANGAVVASIPLDEATAKDIVPKFLKIYNPHKPTFEKLLIWTLKHKITASFIGLGLLVLIVYPIINSIILSI